MADPAFAQKLVLESAFAGTASMMYEYKLRGDKFTKEMDLALINTLGMAAATSATVWLLAPTRSYGSVHKFPWQQVRGRVCRRSSHCLLVPSMHTCTHNIHALADANKRGEWLADARVFLAASEFVLIQNPACAKIICFIAAGCMCVRTLAHIHKVTAFQRHEHPHTHIQCP